jgi:hypothetical protein
VERQPEGQQPRDHRGNARPNPENPRQAPRAQETVTEIRTISGGFSGGGESVSARKAHARKLASKEVLALNEPGKVRKRESEGVTFSEEDEWGVSVPHDDPLVVTMTVANCSVRRILIDNGSSADILYWTAFSQMKISQDKMRPIRTPLVGFAGEKVQPIGVITLLITAGAAPKQASVMADFLVIDRPSAYNAIIGRPTLNKLRAITSTYHLKMKFPTDNGIGEVRGDQVAARNCYNITLRDPIKRETLEVKIDNPGQGMQKAEPAEDMDEVEIDGPDKKVKVGSQLSREIRDKLKHFLQSNKDVFAWTHEDMPGIDPSVIVHQLNVDPSSKPVKQKRRSFAPERNQAAAEEVEKLLQAGFIKEAHYPDWLANVVLVKKANGKWRMCVDFTDLNKACPKDSFHSQG